MPTYILKIMPNKRKTQKVRFHKGDKRRPKTENNLHYIKKMIKRGRKILWQVIEKPKGKIISEFFFEEDATSLVKFQNKHRVWLENGGIPDFLCIKGERELAKE